LKEKISCPNEIEYTFFLVYVKSVSYEEKPEEDTTVLDTVPTITAAMTSIEKGAKMFLAPISLIEFDTFVATHGPGTYVDGKCFS
jgi:mediator of RNA polymerase II transcription subunit 14